MRLEPANISLQNSSSQLDNNVTDADAVEVEIELSDLLLDMFPIKQVPFIVYKCVGYFSSFLFVLINSIFILNLYDTPFESLANHVGILQDIFCILFCQPYNNWFSYFFSHNFLIVSANLNNVNVKIWFICVTTKYRNQYRHVLF